MGVPLRGAGGREAQGSGVDVGDVDVTDGGGVRWWVGGAASERFEVDDAVMFAVSTAGTRIRQPGRALSGEWPEGDAAAENGAV